MMKSLRWWLSGKEFACQCRRRRFNQEDPLEKEMATHSSIFAWETPWTEEAGGLQSMGLQRVGHDLATKHGNHNDEKTMKSLYVASA